MSTVIWCPCKHVLMLACSLFRSVSVMGQWPVPQVIIYYRDIKVAWGREAIATLGKVVRSPFDWYIRRDFLSYARPYSCRSS